MEPVIQIGQQTIDASEVVGLLVKYQILPQLAREVILDQAIESVTCTLEELDQAREEFFQQQRQISDADRQNWMKSRGLSLDQVTQMALRQFKIEKYKRETWGGKLGSYFLKRKATLDRVIYSLLRVKDAGLAQELYFRLVDDQHAFDELARDYSQGPEAQTGGLLGPVDLATPHGAIARMLSVSQPGQLWPPSPVEDWFVILRLDKFLPAQLDDAMRRRLTEELFNAWLNESLQTVKVTLPTAAPPAAAEAGLDSDPSLNPGAESTESPPPAATAAPATP